MMISRITLGMAGRQSLADLESIREREQQAIGQISSGLRVRQPSDGPAEAAGVVETQSSIAAAAQFTANLQTVNEQLRSVDAALHQALDLVQRAESLASEGANFNQTAGTRASIAAEVDGLIQQLIIAANTSFGGKYQFSGTLDGVQPFVADPNSPSGVIYRGDQGRRSVAFPGGSASPVSIDGQTIFLNSGNFLGAGRTPGTIGAAAPEPPVGVGLSFSNGVSGSITADLPSFFVTSGPPSVPAAGGQITVNFTAVDGSISASVTTAPLAGGETAAQIAAALNAQIAASPVLSGKISFSDQGGNLKVTESDTAGVGFRFTSTATSGLVTGLESGGTVGGLSAQEIAAALNAQVARNPSLSSAKIRFSAVNGEVEIDGDTGFDFIAVDFARGTGFVSGLAGQHSVGGAGSANVFGVLRSLHQALLADDTNGITSALSGLQAAVQHLSDVQGFYGAAGNRAQSALAALSQTNLLNQTRLSTLRDADVVAAAANLSQAQINEQAALKAAAQQLAGRSLFDFLA